MDFPTRVLRALFLQPMDADGVIAVDLEEWGNETEPLPGVEHLPHADQLSAWVEKCGWRSDMTKDGQIMFITRPAVTPRDDYPSIRSASPLVMPEDDV